METMFLEITHAEYMGEYSLKVFFNNGEYRVFDFASIIERYPVFAPLSDMNIFKSYVITDTLEWENGRIDIAPEYIYEHGVKPYDFNEGTSATMAAEAPVPYEG